MKVREIKLLSDLRVFLDGLKRELEREVNQTQSFDTPTVLITMQAALHLRLINDSV